MHNLKATQAIRVLKEYCAMGRGAKKSGGRTRSFEAYPRGANDCTGVGEEDMKNVRTVWGANGIHAANMMDIDIDAIGFWALRA
jgi:hypothetical protein